MLYEVITVGALCYVSFAMIAPHTTLGAMYVDMFSDVENAELIVVWGKNPAAHCPPSDFLRIEEAHRRGARIVVIDPRRTALAKYPGAEWVPIRPGSDGALALGIRITSYNVCYTKLLRDASKQ